MKYYSSSKANKGIRVVWLKNYTNPNKSATNFQLSFDYGRDQRIAGSASTCLGSPALTPLQGSHHPNTKKKIVLP